MNILHFCSYYLGSIVYKELFNQIDNNPNYVQDVYIPTKKSSNYQKNFFESTTVNFHCVKIFSSFTRFFYFYKILISLINAYKIFSNSNHQIIHAHTLYSDGIPAYFYSCLFGGKLVVTLRNTDINLGFKYYPQYKWLAKMVLSKAEHIILVSPAHKEKFVEYFGVQLATKVKIITNGISDFYIDNSRSSKLETEQINGLFVGKINKNKNIEYAIKAFFNYFGDSDDIKFTVVGGNYYDYLQCYDKLPSNIIPRVTFIEQLDQTKLIEIYDKSTMLIVPSHRETFGLVFIESISRCLPIVFSSGQGVDGIFDNGVVGFKCNSNCLSSIESSIKSTFENFKDGLFFTGCNNPCMQFSWENICNTYLNEIYI